MTDGEIRKIDLATQKITLRHGAIVNLGMPPMTMAYRVKNPAWLSTLQAGQRIRFAVDRVDGNFTIVALEVVP
jgi:Cu(I)/Ag(I) efflux system protein CusF